MRARPRRRALALLTVLLAFAGVAGCTRAAPPAPPTTAVTGTTPASRAAAIAAGLSDEQLVGQVLMAAVSVPGDVSAAAREVRDLGLGGVVLMGNVEDAGAGASADQVRTVANALQAVAPTLAGTQPGLLIATDQEYGWVTRIRDGMVQLPSAMAFGAANRPELTRDAWSGAGQELAAVGINVDLAPDADVTSSPDNGVIGSRSFGGDPAAVSPQVAAAVTGLQSAGVAATLKHFPGHGNTTVDSHQALPVLAQSRAALEATDLAPFRAGIAAGAQLVMSGHLDVAAIDPGTPASFSGKVIDLLRTELGFDGVVVTDALDMAPAQQWAPAEAAVRAFLAGNDLLLMSPDVAAARSGLLEALGSGRFTHDRLVQSVTRILTLKLTLAAEPRLSTVDTAAHETAASAAAAAAITVLYGQCSGALVSGPVRVTTSAGRAQQAAWLAEALTAQGVTVVTAGGSQVHLVGYGDESGDLAGGAAVTVAMDTPYLLAAADSPVRLATYSSTRAAMRALAAVLAGKAAAPGHSPVPVSGLPGCPSR